MVALAKSNEKEKELTKLLVFEYIKYSGSRPDEEGNSYRFSKILLELLKEGAKKGDVRSDINLDSAAENLTAVYFQSLISWLRSEVDHSFSENISGKIDMLFDGIGS